MNRLLLKEVRKKKGSQEIVAKDLGISRQYLGYLENGERNPTAILMNRISNYFKRPAKKLFPDLFLSDECHKSLQEKESA